MAENKTETVLKDDSKKPMSPEKKQNIIGLAIIGVVTIGLCLTGIFGGEDEIKTSNPADSSVAESVTTTTTTTTLEGDVTASQTDTATSASDDATTTTTTASSVTTKEQETTTTTQKQENVTTTSTRKPETTTTTKTPETTTTTTTTTKMPVSNGKLTADASITNSWESGDGYHAQLSVTLENKTANQIDGWTLSVAVPAGTKVDQAWGCEATVSGNKLILKPADYTKTLAPGQKISDNIGIIVIAGGEFTPSVSVN